MIVLFMLIGKAQIPARSDGPHKVNLVFIIIGLSDAVPPSVQPRFYCHIMPHLAISMKENRIPSIRNQRMAQLLLCAKEIENQVIWLDFSPTKGTAMPILKRYGKGIACRPRNAVVVVVHAAVLKIPRRLNVPTQQQVRYPIATVHKRVGPRFLRYGY